MEDRSHALIAILFLVVFGVGAGAVSWWMMTPGAARVPYLLTSEGSVAGLGPGSPVVYKGIKVGSVSTVRLDARTHRNVNVLIRVDQNFPLTRNSYAVLGSNGLIGNKNVDLHLGLPGPVLHTSARSPAQLELRPGVMGQIVSRAARIVDEAQQTLAAIHHLVSGSNARAISETLQHIAQVSRRLERLERQTGTLLTRLPPVLKEATAALQQSRQLLANANRLAIGARRPVQAIGRAAGAAAGLATQFDQSTMPQLGALVRRLGTLSEHLQALVGTLQRTPQSLIRGPARQRAGPGETRGRPRSGG